MTVELWIGRLFEHTHERRALDFAMKSIHAEFDSDDEILFVFANYSFEG